jgi:hypothetical protein
MHFATSQSTVANQCLTPTIFRSDFVPGPGASPDSGSRDGWESYPIAQEAGYDPTIQPETSAGISALVREAAPLQDGPFQLGFIRRLHLVTGQAASIHLRFRIPYATGATTIHISLYRGEAEEQHALIVKGNRWQEADLDLPANPTQLSAVAIAADFPLAIHNRAERFLITDVSIHALATRRIDLVAPQALWDPTRELYYLQRALHPGEQLEVTPSGQQGSEIHWTLTAPNGDLTEQGSGGQVRHRFSADAKPGIYTLTLTSKDASTKALLLLKSPLPVGLVFDRPPSTAPELLQSIRDRRAVLEKTAQPSTGVNIATMDAHWLLPGLPSYFAILLQSPELAMLDAMEYRATRDPSALARSLTLLRAVETWPQWVHPWFPAHGYHSYYPVGIMTKYLVLAEEFLGSDLPAVDRRVLNDRLMELSIKPAYQEYVQEDRLQFNTSNWIGNTAGGALLAALASDAPDSAGYALGLYVKERDHVQAAYTVEGSYGEGVTYHRFDLEMTSLVAAASKRLLGQSMDSLMANGERYMQYAAYSSDGVLDFGDSHVDLRPSNVFAYQAATNTSPSLTDFYFKYRDTGTAQIISRLLFEPSIVPASGESILQSPSHIFDQRGIAVLRDNWNSDASVVAMRAGPNFNHNHADEGSIFFAHHGKIWLGEAGYADYYKDPSYQSFNLQAIGHNVLLVDNNIESQVIPGNNYFGAYPRIVRSYIGEAASLVQADLTSAYASTLQRYTRTLFFVPGGPLVVIDDVAASVAHTYTLIWHPKQKVVDDSTGASSFRLSDGRDTLDLRTYSPMLLTAAQRPSPLPLVDYDRSERELIATPVHFEFSTAMPTRAAIMVTVMEPHEATEQTDSPMNCETGSSVARLYGKNIEIEIKKADESDPYGPQSTLIARWKQGAFMLHGTLFKDSTSSCSITASLPIDMQLTRQANSPVHIEIDAKVAANLQVSGMSEEHPSTCRLGSTDSRSTSRSIIVPSGHTVLTLYENEATMP